MYRVHLLAGVLLLATCGFAQQPDTVQNPTPDTYARNTYNQPVEVRHSYGNWGLLGLLGLTGLLGRGRRTIVRDRDEYATGERRRVA
jgi:hypothetical protein